MQRRTSRQSSHSEGSINVAHAVCMQDWITLTGDASAVIVQDAGEWLELAEYQDVAIYLELANATNTNATTIDLQTSPTLDETFFSATPSGGNPYIARFSVTSASAVGVQPLQFVRWAAASTTAPLGRYVRWKASFPALSPPTTVTFRIWLSLNQAGWA